MAVQVLTPPDSSNKLSIAAAIAGNRRPKQGPNVSIGGPDAIQLYNAISNRDLAKKQLALTEKENALDRTNRLEIEETRNSGNMAVQKLANQGSLDVTKQQGVNTIEAQRSATDEALRAQRGAQEFRDENFLKKYGPTGVPQDLPYQDRWAMAIENKNELELTQQIRGTEFIHDQLQRIAGNTPDAIRANLALSGNESLIKPPDNSGAFNAARIGTRQPGDDKKAVTGAGLLDIDNLNGRPTDMYGMAFGTSAFDAFPKNKIGDASNVTPDLASAKVREGMTRQLTQMNLVDKVATGNQIAAQTVFELGKMLTSPNQLFQQLYKTGQEVINYQNRVSDASTLSLKQGKVIAGAVNQFSLDAAKLAPDVIKGMDPKGVIDYLATQTGTSDRLAAIRAGSAPPENAGEISGWSYRRLQDANYLNNVMSILRTEAASLRTRGGPKALSLAEKYEAAANSLVADFSIASADAGKHDEQGATQAGLLQIFNGSVKDQLQTPSKPGETPISAQSVVNALRGGTAGLGKYMSQTTAELTGQGREVNTNFFNEMDQVPAHKDPTNLMSMSILTGEAEEYKLNPEEFGMPGVQPPDRSLIEHHFKQRTAPVDLDIFHRRVKEINAGFRKARDAAKAEFNRRIAEQQEKLKLQPSSTPQGGSGGSSQPSGGASKSSGSQPKKSESPGGKK